jgi:NAD(P)H-dependent flavin oxidoreductase YrpB (nitropropane dioxygenase family)
MIQGTWLEREELRDVVFEVRRRTNKPFGVNFVLPLMEREDYAILDMALDLEVPVISTFWADPSPVIDRIHKAGAFSLHTVGSASEARKVVELGVDAVVAQGFEAGGHVWGQAATMILTPAVVDAVPATPVIAAGGIADGRGLAAVLALGAQAAWIGTRLLLAEECDTHPAYRERLKAAQETDTVLTSLFDGGWPGALHRCLRNETFEAWVAAGCPASGQRPNEGEVVAHYKGGVPIARYDIDEPISDVRGNAAAMALYAGQSVVLSKEEKPVAQILQEMVADASERLLKFSNG